MAPVSETIEITATPHDVFAYVADLRNLPLWQESVERVAVTTPTTEVGTVLAEQRTGDQASSAYVVADCEPDSRLTLVAVDGDVRPEETLRLEPILDGRSTRVEYAVDYDAHGLQRMAAARARHRTRRSLRTDLEHLKHEVESAGSAPAHVVAVAVPWSSGPTTGEDDATVEAAAIPPQPIDPAERGDGVAADDVATAPGAWREKGDGVVPPVRFY